MKPFYLALFLGMLCAWPVSAQNVLKSESISGWDVTKIETPRDGLSCQAFKCNTRNCNGPSAEAFVRLWGSNRRQAITPMIGMQQAAAGAGKATVAVAGRSFPLEQAKRSKGKLYIARRASDDAKIMKLIATNPDGTITFASNKGSAVFRLKGVGRVLAFFQKECAIPLP